jgi:hypothetical protein
MTTELLLKIGEIKTELTTQRQELNDKFKEIDKRLSKIEIFMNRIDVREQNTGKLAVSALQKAENAEKLAWLGFGGGSAGVASSLAKLVGLI